jgi:hypothetical protein
MRGSSWTHLRRPVRTAAKTGKSNCRQPAEVIVVDHWTNDEGEDGGAVTTVTFEEKGGKTLLVVHDLYPSKEALDSAIASGATAGMPETLEQLDELLVTLGVSVGRS